jgi:tRNA 2-selenouridine synthase
VDTLSQSVCSSRGAPPRRAVLLIGLAGAGKTLLLHRLAELGEQVIDLERLANHSGSVFGGLGKSPQPSHNHFQQLVGDAWSSANPELRLWLEDEGPFIGSVGLPLWLLDVCAGLPVVEVVADRETRISRLVDEYGSIPAAQLEGAVKRLDQRLARAEAAIDAIRARRLPEAIEMVLDYYDSAYNHRMKQHQRRILATYRSNTDEPRDLIRLVDENLRGVLDA